jgi:hypothetical protein
MDSSQLCQKHTEERPEQPFAPDTSVVHELEESKAYHLSQISPDKERGQGETALCQVEQLSQTAREPGHTRAVGLANAPMVGVGLLPGFFSVGVGA